MIDLHLVAYASLYEVVRMYLAGEVNIKYLRKRHKDIEEDLQQEVIRERQANDRSASER